MAANLVHQVPRLILEEALEAEAEDALGRGHYDRGQAQSVRKVQSLRSTKRGEAYGRSYASRAP